MELLGKELLDGARARYDHGYITPGVRLAETRAHPVERRETDEEAAFLAASILPLSTAYSVCEYVGVEAALDDPFREAKTFYLTYGTVTAISAVVVLAPNIPLVTILVGTQVLNAVLLIPLLVAMVGLGRDRDLMGRFATGRRGTLVYALTTAVVIACVLALGLTTLLG